MEHWKVWRPNPQDALHAAGPGPQAQVTAEAFSGMGPGRGGREKIPPARGFVGGAHAVGVSASCFAVLFFSVSRAASC